MWDKVCKVTACNKIAATPCMYKDLPPVHTTKWTVKQIAVEVITPEAIRVLCVARRTGLAEHYAAVMYLMAKLQVYTIFEQHAMLQTSIDNMGWVKCIEYAAQEVFSRMYEGHSQCDDEPKHDITPLKRKHGRESIDRRKTGANILASGLADYNETFYLLGNSMFSSWWHDRHVMEISSLATSVFMRDYYECSDGDGIYDLVPHHDIAQIQKVLDPIDICELFTECVAFVVCDEVTRSLVGDKLSENDLCNATDGRSYRYLAWTKSLPCGMGLGLRLYSKAYGGPHFYPEELQYFNVVVNDLCDVLSDAETGNMNSLIVARSNGVCVGCFFDQLLDVLNQCGAAGCVLASCFLYHSLTWRSYNVNLAPISDTIPKGCGRCVNIYKSIVQETTIADDNDELNSNKALILHIELKKHRSIQSLYTDWYTTLDNCVTTPTSSPSIKAELVHRFSRVDIEFQKVLSDISYTVRDLVLLRWYTIRRLVCMGSTAWGRALCRLSNDSLKQ